MRVVFIQASFLEGTKLSLKRENPALQKAEME